MTKDPQRDRTHLAQAALATLALLLGWLHLTKMAGDWGLLSQLTESLLRFFPCAIVLGTVSFLSWQYRVPRAIRNTILFFSLAACASLFLEVTKDIPALNHVAVFGRQSSAWPFVSGLLSGIYYGTLLLFIHLSLKAVAKSQQQLKKQSAILELFFKHTLSQVVLLDKDFNFIRVNEAYARACERDISEFAGRNHFELYPSDTQQIFEEVVATKEPFQTFARPFVFPDAPDRGVTYWDWTLVPILDKDDDVEMLVFSLNDVTQSQQAEEKLRESEAQLRSVLGTAKKQSKMLELFFEHTHCQIAFLDREFNFIRVNDAYARGCDKDISEFAGRNRFDLYPSDAQHIFKEVVATKIPFQSYARPFVNPNSPERGVAYRDWTLVPVLDNDGNVELLVSSLNDVTQRQLAEEELHEKHNLLNAVIEGSTDAVYVKDLEGRYLTANSECSRVMGKSVDEIVGKNDADLFSPDLGHELMVADRAIMESGKSQTLEEAINDVSSNSVRTFLSMKAPFRDKKGQVIGLIGISRDITERKQAEEKLRESETQLRSVLETATDFILSLDLDGKILYINRTQLGILREDVIGASVFSFLPPEKHQRLRDVMRSVRETQNAHGFDVSSLGPNGEPAYYAGFIGAVLIEKKVVGFTICATDDTERKRAEEALLTVVEGTARSVGDDYMQSLVRHLAAAFECRHVILAELIGDDMARARTIAVWRGDELAHNFEYDLAGTPCEKLVRQGACFYPRDVKKEFPDAQLLLDMGVEGYMGTPLIDSNGRVIGVLAAMDDHPISERPEVRSILSIFAARAAAELERSRTEKKLADASALLGETFNSLEDALFVVAPGERTIITCNSAAERIFGYKSQELIGQSTALLYTDPASYKKFGGQLSAALDASGRFHSEGTLRRCDGTRFDAEHTIAEVVDKSGKRSAIVSLVRDVSRRKEAERELRRANRGLQMLSEAHRAVGRTDNESELLQEICRICVDVGGYRMAWMGAVEPDEAKTLRPIETAGVDIEYAQSIKLSWSADSEFGRGPCGMSVRAKRPVAVQNTETDPRYKPWREEAAKFNFRSVIALPLLDDGHPFAVLCMYAERVNAFGAAEVELLTGLVDNLANGITSLRNQRARVKAEERLRIITDSLPVLISYIDHAQRYQFNNATYERWLNLKREDLKGRHLRDQLGEEAYGRIESHVLAALSGRDVNFDSQISLPDGSSRDVSVNFVAHADSDGTPLGFYSVSSDVTNRKQTEERLKKSEAESSRLRAQLTEAIESLTEGFALYDADDRLVMCNNKYREVYKEVADLFVIGVRFEDHIRKAAYRGHLVEAVGQEEEWIRERVRQHQHPEGVYLQQVENSRWVQISERPTKEGGIVGVRTDVTDLVQAQRQLLQRERELAHADRLSMLGQITAGVAHEIMQPVYAIGNFATVCRIQIEKRENIDFEKTLEWIDSISNSVTTVKSLFSRLRKYAADKEPHRTPFQLSDAINNVLALLRFDLKEKKISVELDLDTSISVNAVEIQMWEVFTNLIRNACDALYEARVEDARIIIRSQVEDGFAHLCIEDNGPGISAGSLDNVFDSFYTTKDEGLGLGLSISRSIINSHGGKMWILPNEDRGVTFHLRLPCISRPNK